MSPLRTVVVLGSTGSIGRQATAVVRAAPDRFRIVGLAAGGADLALLARQTLEFDVEAVAIARPAAAEEFHPTLAAVAAARGLTAGEFVVPKVLTGPDAAAELAAHPCDVVLNGMTGSVGLRPTLAALESGRTLALANKESLVAGGPLVAAVARPGQIVPVDSEHSALAQCLRSGRTDEVRRLVLTASGGPFRGRSRADLATVTVRAALAHPTWDMGPVVTVNSATMMNKGLELIEAHMLFDIPYDALEVVVHPQSVVHSMVEFCDGSTVCQASPPDMRLPIALAMGWPDRVPAAARPVDWTAAQSWTFEPLDGAAFPAVALARAAGTAGGYAPAVLNAANEEAVAAFLAGGLPFLGIVDTVGEVLAEAPAHGHPTSVEDVVAVERWARARVRELMPDEAVTALTAMERAE
ncbi:MAG: 1-deoxy-D-xylulose-5-phosphate reductoisomerase [Actinobacteria bacterium]|nr:1-deoxy-D-xylulose-5-phosphate reductoisomerase [Actinomycetota bacterium]